MKPKPSAMFVLVLGAILLVVLPMAVLLWSVLLVLWLVCPAKVERAMRGPFPCPRGPGW